MQPIQTELGNSLLDREFTAPDNGHLVFFAVYRDTDLHSFSTNSFVPNSGGEFMIWVTENLTMAKRLGHNWLGIYRTDHTGNQDTDPKNLIEAWARTERGDWMAATIMLTIEQLDGACNAN
jgi:hypothetical protein